ncbi:MAG: hypothetical protein PHD51_00460 [Patescibacteria group bacterium]|nr:hypothetical protein [Patescibacteria group bacterium]MDD5490660.1 hypothetical protein [Patescibacteria group bacterium]
MAGLKYKNNRERGQGLLETVIALSIIVTGLVGALSLAVANLASSSDSGQRIIAGNLAREAVEVIRNKRDSNWLGSKPWDDGLYFADDPPGDHSAIVKMVSEGEARNWILDFGPDNINDSAAGLKLEEYLYNSEAGESTNFSRLVTIDEICSDYTILTEESGSSCEEKIGLRVLAEIKWTDRGRPHSLVAEDRLYNWR